MPSRQFDLHAVGHSQNHEAPFDVFHIGDMVEVDRLASAGGKKEIGIKAVADALKSAIDGNPTAVTQDEASVGFGGF